MIHATDDYLLDHIFQPASNQVDWWTGFNRVAQGRGVLIVYMLGKYATMSSGAYVQLACMLVIVVSVYGRSLYAEKQSGKIGLNSERVTGFLLRIFWLGMIPFGIAVGLTDTLDNNIVRSLGMAAYVALPSTCYLIACSAPPPKVRREVRQLKEVPSVA